MQYKIFGFSKDKRTASVSFTDADFKHRRKINCSFTNGVYDKAATIRAVEAMMAGIEHKKQSGIL